MADKVAIIAGVTGQDGTYLAESLLSKGYQVVGLTRDPALHCPHWLEGVEGPFSLRYCQYTTADLITLLNEIRPQEIYNLAGQSYVGKSWRMVEETFKSAALLPVNFLEAILRVDPSIRFFQASSSQVYAPSQSLLEENSPFGPQNPYGCSKLFAHNMVTSYRNNYGLFAANGILFNHESPRRDADFLCQKIVQRAVAIKRGKASQISLGNIDIKRDFGYAKEYVEAMHLLLQMKEPLDVNICSGKAILVRDLVSFVFSELGLDYRDYLTRDQSLVRASEPEYICGSNRRAKEVLGWSPSTDIFGVLRIMLDYEMSRCGESH